MNLLYGVVADAVDLIGDHKPLNNVESEDKEQIYSSVVQFMVLIFKVKELQ